MTPKNKARIRLALEELVQQILLPRKPELQIHVTVEYSPQEETTNITVTYCGDRFDPLDSDNDLSLSVLKSTVDVLSYRYDLQSGKMNRIDLRIKAS